MESKLLLDRTEVAELLGVSTRVFDRLVRTAHVPGFVRVGKSLRWNRHAIENWIAAGCGECDLEKVAAN